MIGEIVLPWPPRSLNPNGRAHWRVKHRDAKIAKDFAFYATKEARIGVAAGDVPVLVGLTFHPKTATRPDEDNCIASMKAGLDGIALALGLDDQHFRLAAPVIAEPVNGGKVVVTIGSPSPTTTNGE